MFELHFDGAHIGPTFGGSADDDEGVDTDATAVDVTDAAEADATDVTDTESTDDDTRGSGWGRRVAFFAVVVGAVAVGRTAMRRFRSDADADEEFVVEAGDEEAHEESTATEEPTAP